MNNKDSFKLSYELLKLMLKPGYVYGVGEDGEIYCCETTVPISGRTSQYMFQAAEKDLGGRDQ